MLASLWPEPLLLPSDFFMELISSKIYKNLSNTVGLPKKEEEKRAGLKTYIFKAIKCKASNKACDETPISSRRIPFFPF
jgi:hypothetical protein